MPRELDNLRRRPFFFPLLLPLAMLVVLAMVASWLFDARATTVVFVVRHAESAASVDGDPPLDDAGRARAARLGEVLAQAQPVRGLDAIYASELRRAQETVTPLSQSLALPVNVVPTATWPGLARRMLREHRGEYLLAVGNVTSVPALVEDLSGQVVSLKEDEHDTLFVVFVSQFSKARVVRLKY